MIPLLLLLAALQESNNPAQTRTVLWNDSGIAVRIPLSTPDWTAGTAILFPEESLDSIVVSWKEEALSLERNRNILFLKLLKPAEGEIHVLGGSGTLYRIWVKPVSPKDPYDAQVRIERPAPREKSPTPSLELIRAMRTRELPPGIQVRSADQTLQRTPESEIQLRLLYDSPTYQGYTLVLRNTSRDPLRVDPSRFTAEGLVLIGAAEMLLPPGGETELYLIFSK